MKWVRWTHRWLGVVFAVVVVVTGVVLAVRGPVWASYVPLPPLVLLWLSGLTMLGVGYARARRRGARSGAPGARRVHRWAGVVFTVSVVATFVALALPEPVVWVSYLPLFPLAALLFSGLYMVALPYGAERRRVRRGPRSAPVGS
ncbi:hypothetical protein [Nocardia pseudobrasiliensis]|uniref:Uncharacterized protein n=1 Tax=Nocardia pseudobrasiliensis TaxID=45979 RepID=A0A370I413_9NOCA|nr:hypothetical protein [Nocardia pseudobrasiliensis]RDI64064.1 hypothetical protein DFR76_109405 [Nocardia pseudobrasiliensis]